jgi:hypothetical protein
MFDGNSELMLGETKTYILGEADGAGGYRWCPGRP